LSDPVNGHGEIPILLEGTLIGSTGENGEHLDDPTLYKVAPKSTNHMELRDPMEELRQQQTSNSVTEVTDVSDVVTPPLADDKGKEEESEAEKPQKEEMTAPAADSAAAAPAAPTVQFKFFLSSSIVPALIKEGGGGRLAQVASVWKGQFGPNFHGLDSVRYAKNQVELALVDKNKSR
jgi:hypothetical protein